MNKLVAALFVSSCVSGDDAAKVKEYQQIFESNSKKCD